MSANLVATGQSHVGNGQPAKRRAACDECRTRKLKCSGEQPACARCARENTICVYSAQKQMGRPKKRARSNVSEEHDVSSTQAADGAHLEQMGGYGVDTGDITQLDESYQAWSQQPVSSWVPNDVPVEGALPALTPDTSSDSPSLSRFPPELQRNNSRHTSSQLLVDSSLDNVGSGTDPSLFPVPSSCACLSTMYLSLNNLQQMTQPYRFPFSLYPLREAMSAATSVLECEECPRRFITGMHNTQMVGTLLVSIAERFGKVLDSITSEAVRAEMLSERKKFRLADLNTENSHLHTGGLGCAAAFSIDLSPDEWRSMSKKVVRAEVHGPHAGAGQSSSIVPDEEIPLHSHTGHDPQGCQNFSNTEHASCAYLMGLIKQMLMRQDRWHKDMPPDDFPLDRDGNLVAAMRSDSDEHPCLRMPAYAAKLVQAFDWT
nr:c6 finger domain transcription factor tcpz [Quercus suber]